MTIFNQNNNNSFVYSDFTTIFATDYNHTCMEVKTIIKQKGFTMEAVAKKMGIIIIKKQRNQAKRNR